MSVELRKLPQRRRHVGVSLAVPGWHELRTKLYCLEEGFDLGLILGYRPLLDMRHLLRVWRHTLLGEDVAEPFYFWLAEITFLLSEAEAILVQPLEDSSQVLVVLSVRHFGRLALSSRFCRGE